MGVRRLAGLSAIAAIAFFGLSVGSASADTYGTCSGHGKLTAQNGTPKATWQLSATGDCISSPVGKSVVLTGSGTSNTLGLCTRNALLVTDLKLNVDMAFTNDATGVTENEQQTWYSPISLFPIATPYLVARSSYSDFPARLAGIALHHLTLRCHNGGQSPAALFTWIST